MYFQTKILDSCWAFSNIFSRACHSVQRGKGEYHVTDTYMILFKLVQYVAHTSIDKRAVGLPLKGLLVHGIPACALLTTYRTLIGYAHAHSNVVRVIIRIKLCSHLVI